MPSDPTSPTFSAALIAGGKSSRFGEDKAFLQWRGQPLFAFQLAKLGRLNPDEVFLSANPAQPFPDFMEGISIVHDAGELGPIGGLAACLDACQSDFLVVLAVDLPNLPADYLSQITSRQGGAVPIREGRFEPLVAVYPKAILPLVRKQIEQGELSLQQLVRKGEAEGLLETFEVESEVERAGFANLNRPEDLATIQQGWFIEPTGSNRSGDFRAISSIDDESRSAITPPSN